MLHAQREDLWERKMKKFGKKAPGIVVKMAKGLPQDLAERAWGIRFSKGPSIEDMWGVWRAILLAKFEQNDAARGMLLSTGGERLVEFSRFPGESRNFWGAYLDKKTNRLEGKNVMGHFLMRIRDILRKK
jgi:hypothetical protein